MYKAVKLSLIKLIQDEILGMTPISPVVFVDWDAHANMSELPKEDIAGLNGLIVRESDKIYEVSFAVTCCTLADTALGRLTDIVDHFQRKFRPHTDIALYSPELNARVGNMVVLDGVNVSPLSRAEVRPTVSIMVSALVTPSPAVTLLG